MSIAKGYRLPGGSVYLLTDSTRLKIYDAGEWLQEKHGAWARCTWRKLHLAVDALTGMIKASALTENDVIDPSRVAPLLDQVDAEIDSIMADCVYDGMPTYDTVIAHGENIAVVIPAPVTALHNDAAELNPLQRKTPARVPVDIYSSRTHKESKPLSYIEYIITDWTQQLQVGTIFTGKGVIQQGFKDLPLSFTFNDFFFQETSHAFDFSF